MTASDRTGSDSRDRPDRSEAELVADAVSAVPGVFGLHAGAVGEAVTLLPGRRVAGIRITDEGSEVHISVEHGQPVREVAEAVRQATHGIVDRPVTVFVEDVTTPEPTAPEPTAPEPTTQGPTAAASSPSDAVEPGTDTPDITTSAPTGAEERN